MEKKQKQKLSDLKFQSIEGKIIFTKKSIEITENVIKPLEIYKVLLTLNFVCISFEV